MAIITPPFDLTQLKPVIIDNFSVDDLADTAGVPYWFGSAVPADLWIKPELSSDAAILVASTIQPIWCGATLQALTGVPQPLVHQAQEQSLRCNVFFGNLNSVSRDDFLQGKNIAYVGASGRWECIYFRDVSFDETTKITTLSHLLRGKRGTEIFTYGHTAKEGIVFPQFSGDLVKFTRPLSELATPGDPTAMPIISPIPAKIYKTFVVPAGQPVTTKGAPTGRLSNGGLALAPWAPVNCRLTRTGSDIVITWTRVDRAPSTMHDGDDTTPLSDAESYTLQIYKTPVDVSAQPTRIVEALTTPTYTYLAADQTTDGTDTDLGLGIVITQDGIVPGHPLSGVFRVN